LNSAAARGANIVISAAPAAIIDAASAIAAASNPKICSQIFRGALAAFEINTFACGQVDLLVRERNVFYAIDWPETWRKFYLSAGVLQRDPLLDALKRRRKPFTWSELRSARAIVPIGSEALRLAAEHGWTEGLAVPIPHGKNRCGLVSLAGPRGLIGEAEKSLLAILSLSFYERQRSFAPDHGFPIAPIGLTKREIDCLRLIARGATDREVGRTLGISAETAHEYFEKAKRKLRVSTRAEAVAIAISCAIISV
jgi:DNA-binding CsgD family transcriptional regulator